MIVEKGQSHYDFALFYVLKTEIDQIFINLEYLLQNKILINP
jgi:hypothetical protein